MKHVSYLGFAIFLVIYSVIKYRAVPELMGQPTYIKSTIILVILTAILPYFIALFVRGKMAGTSKLIASLVLPLILCLVGLATYFYVFIAPNAPGMSVTQVLPRAIIPGLVMGLILAQPLFMHRKD